MEHPKGQAPEAGDAFVTSLAQALRSADAEERRQATAELGRARPSDVRELLLAALGDEDWRVRKEATVAARAFGLDRALVSSLVHALGDADHVGLRNAAVEVLATLGEVAIQRLADALPSFDADARKLAVEALARSGSRAALPVLELLRGDRDANVRAAAVEAIAGLGEVAPERVAPILLAELESDDPVILVATLTGLTELGVQAPWERLEVLLHRRVLRGAAVAAAALVPRRESALAITRVLAESVAEGARREGVPVTYETALHTLGVLARGELAIVIRDALVASGPEIARRLVATSLPPASAPARSPSPAFVKGGPSAVRGMALRLGALIGAPGVVDAAITALSDHLVADEAERALTTVGAAGLTAMLGRLADAEVPADARGVLVDVIVDLVAAEEDLDPSRTRAAIAALRGAARDPDAPVAVRALRGLARVGGPGDLELLADETLASNRVVGMAAETALLALTTRFPDAARALIGKLAVDPARALPTAILIASTARGALRAGGAVDADAGGVEDASTSERHAAFLAQAATAGAPGTRRAAVEAVAALRAARGASYAGALDVLAFALADEEHEVKLAAARALGHLAGSGSSAPAPSATEVIDLAQRSGEPDLVAAMLRAMSGGGTAWPPGDTSRARGSEAHAAREDRSGPSSSSRDSHPFVPEAELLAALAAFAKTGTSVVALAAVDALASAQRSGAEGATPALAGALDHTDLAVIKAAILKLAEAERGRAVLLERLTTSRDADVATVIDAMQRALRQSPEDAG